MFDRSKFSFFLFVGPVARGHLECMVTGRASVESDVYSFGVALLELACGRCPVMTRPDGSAVHLAQRVRELHDAGRVTAAADGRLNGGFDGDEMERVLVVGLWCAHPDRGMRPAIRQAVNVLRFDAPLPSLPPPAKMPAAPPAMVDTSCSVRSESSYGDDPI